MSQAMLLSRRLTTFLSQNTTPQLPTLILLSPTGKLLSSSSPHPASVLRTQATHACSLWNIYLSNTHASLVSIAHPPSSSTTSKAPPSDSASTTEAGADASVSTITIQLSHGVMVIRGLSCGLLLVAIGPPSPSPSTSSTSTTAQSSPHPSSHALRSSHTSPPPSPLPQTHVGGEGGGGGESGGGIQETGTSGFREGSVIQSDAGSVLSVGTATGTVTGVAKGSVMLVKRRAAEVARWLDEQLEGFQLSAGMEK